MKNVLSKHRLSNKNNTFTNKIQCLMIKQLNYKTIMKNSV
jgi:hypothetical protein